MHIVLSDDVEPVPAHVRKIKPHLEQSLCDQLNSWLRDWIIAPRPRSANAITWHPAPGGRKGEEDTLSLPGSRAVATPVLSLSHKTPPAANVPQIQKAAPPKNLHLPLPSSPSSKLSPKSPAKKSRSPNLLKKVQAVKTGLQFVNSLSPDSKTPH